MKLQKALVLLINSVVIAGLSACGGSSGGKVADRQPAQSEQTIPQDDALSCDASLDVADFLITEIDRQWSCEITSNNGVMFDDVYFSRSGTAVFGNTGKWYWNRNLPSDDINLASPDHTSVTVSEISSSNTVLSFTSATPAGTSERYDCILVSREIVL